MGMKTYLLIIGASVVLTLAAVCIVSFQTSQPESAVQPQSAHPVQKQTVDRSTMNKNLVSKTPASAPVAKTAGPVPARSAGCKHCPSKAKLQQPTSAVRTSEHGAVLSTALFSLLPCSEAKAINASPPSGGLLLILCVALQIKIRHSITLYAFLLRWYYHLLNANTIYFYKQFVYLR
jgi:hypothetical protein